MLVAWGEGDSGGHVLEIETSCLVDGSKIRIGNWIETCKQHIPVLLYALWRRGSVLHVNIIVSIGIKFASGERKEISIFVSNQIGTPLPMMVESNDIARVIIAHKAFATWMTEDLHGIQSIPIFSLLNPIGSCGQRILHIKKSEQIVHI